MLISDTAYADIPKSCRQDKSCPVYVVFHECLQGAKVIGNKYYNHTGYNEMANANNLIILYLPVKPSFTLPLNPQRH